MDVRQKPWSLHQCQQHPISNLCTTQWPVCAGTIGHVAHGKSTVVKAISGVQTVRFKNELERNITIKLGYANAKIYKAKDPRVPRYSITHPCLSLRLVVFGGDLREKMCCRSLLGRNVERLLATAGRLATRHMAAARKTRRRATTLDMSTQRWSWSGMSPLSIAQVGLAACR